MVGDTRSNWKYQDSTKHYETHNKRTYQIYDMTDEPGYVYDSNRKSIFDSKTSSNPSGPVGRNNRYLN